MGRGAAFGYVVWAIAQNQLPKGGTRQKFLKACHILKGTVMLQSACISTVITRAYTTQVLNSWYLKKKIWFLAVAMAQYEFRI
jgi:hypothetical protein